MRNLLLEDENATFNFSGPIVDDFYVININRARYKEKINARFMDFKYRWNFLYR